MSGNPQITPAIANRVANFPRLCYHAECFAYCKDNGEKVPKLARYVDVAWDILKGKPTVVGHTVLVGDTLLHIEIGNAVPLHVDCTQCGREPL